MGNAIPLQVETKTEYTLIDAGETVVVDVRKVEHKSSPEGAAKKWDLLNLQLIVRGPVEYAGKRLFHTQFLGSKSNNKQLDAIWAAAGLPTPDAGAFAEAGIADIDEVMADLTGARFACEVGVNEYTKKELEDGEIVEKVTKSNNIAHETEKSWSDLLVYPVSAVNIEVLEDDYRS